MNAAQEIALHDNFLQCARDGEDGVLNRLYQELSNQNPASLDNDSVSSINPESTRRSFYSKIDALLFCLDKVCDTLPIGYEIDGVSVSLMRMRFQKAMNIDEDFIFMRMICIKIIEAYAEILEKKLDILNEEILTGEETFPAIYLELIDSFCDVEDEIFFLFSQDILSAQNAANQNGVTHAYPLFNQWLELDGNRRSFERAQKKRPGDMADLLKRVIIADKSGEGVTQLLNGMGQNCIACLGYRLEMQEISLDSYNEMVADIVTAVAKRDYSRIADFCEKQIKFYHDLMRYADQDERALSEIEYAEWQGACDWTLKDGFFTAFHDLETDYNRLSSVMFQAYVTTKFSKNAIVSLGNSAKIAAHP